ncbi:hypothetical protein GCM10025863_06830 [Microbacterium suwonense]|uniref:C2H2-type domain-containing protein n=1 Tax=Microbacterium suwonense TaxID=683047 RepID=A0ABN6X0E7_9MICO|nr:hypothetical protein GCM10025863_06830 [Microbacterium suwonense]
MSGLECRHLNGLAYGGYALCFDCGAESGPDPAPAPAPSIVAQRLEVVGVIARGRPSGPSGEAVLCPVCTRPVSSLHALTAHAVAAHPVPEAVA